MKVDVLIPTRNRTEALVATLTSLYYQTHKDFGVTIANQSDEPIGQDEAVQSVLRLLRYGGHETAILDNRPPQGMAQQRQFLLEAVTAPYCLYIDDDVLLEPFVIRNMLQVIREESIGFVGQGLIGLSYANDYRPEEETIELWDGSVTPEAVEPNDANWQRYRLHNAANVLHVQETLGATPEHVKTYKVAWVGGCVLYDTEKLRQAGGFSFWQDVPKEHAGEDVYAQLRVMRRYGGCGLLPSGAYHQEAPTTITNRSFDIPKELPL